MVASENLGGLFYRQRSECETTVDKFLCIDTAQYKHPEFEYLQIDAKYPHSEEWIKMCYCKKTKTADCGLSPNQHMSIVWEGINILNIFQ